MTTMSELHPTAVNLAKIETDYAKTLAKLTTLKDARRTAKTARRTAIVEAAEATPDATYVDLGRRFGVTEGTIRHILTSTPSAHTSET